MYFKAYNEANDFSMIVRAKDAIEALRLTVEDGRERGFESVGWTVEKISKWDILKMKDTSCDYLIQDGKIDEKDGGVTMIETLKYQLMSQIAEDTAMKMAKEMKLVLPLGDDRNLVVRAGSDVYKELYISVETDEDDLIRDLCVVRQSYHYNDNGDIIQDQGKYEVLLSNEDGTDFTPCVKYEETKQDH